MTARLVDVALPLPLFRAFTYVVPDSTRHPVEPGARVVVPFRNRTAIGIVVERAAGVLGDGVVPKAILDVPDPVPALKADLLAVCRWMADYYVSPVGLLLRAALPAAMGARQARRAVRQDAARAAPHAGTRHPAAARRAVQARATAARAVRTARVAGRAVASAASHRAAGLHRGRGEGAGEARRRRGGQRTGGPRPVPLAAGERAQGGDAQRRATRGNCRAQGRRAG